MPRVYRVLSPYITALYAMPKIALAPLFVIVLGIGIESKVALVAITVFFLVLNSTLDGVRNVDRDLVRSLALMGATRFEVIAQGAGAGDAAVDLHRHAHLGALCLHQHAARRTDRSPTVASAS